VTIATEHRAVLDPCRTLERQGFRVTYLDVDRGGRIDVEQLRQAVTADTLLVSAMSANNEIGVLHPIEEISAIAHAEGALFHCDAAQSAGLVGLDVRALGIDLMSLSGHKMYGPKGVGALYIAKRDPAIELEALIDGGGHERGFRSGTLDVPAIVGFGKAAELCRESMEIDPPRLRTLRDRLWSTLSALDGVHVNGAFEPRLPNNLNVRVDDVHGETLLKAIASDLAVSSGAACATASAEPSHVLRAIGLSDEQARASIRFGLSRFTSEQEIDAAGEIVAASVKQLRR
jgi:cysteine desulfurase